MMWELAYLSGGCQVMMLCDAVLQHALGSTAGPEAQTVWHAVSHPIVLGAQGLSST